MNQKKVLHLAPHLGGGVGSVVIDFLKSANLVDKSSKFVHDLGCLDANHTKTVSNLNKCNIPFEESLYSNIPKLQALVAKSDIVLLHFWNHPLLTKLLVSNVIPPCRLISWCHNSGMFEPSTIPNSLVSVSSKTIFTSSVSLQVPNLINEMKLRPKKFKVIHSRRDLLPFQKLDSNYISNKPLTKLLYIGTVSYDKLHEEILPISLKLEDLGFELIYIGGPDHEVFSSALPKKSSSIRFLGPRSNIKQYLKEADIFIYPLSPSHYGTGEQALLEAMASSLPIVAFDNPPEKQIINHKVNGILANSKDEFIKYVVDISANQRLANSLGINARNKINEHFSFPQLIFDFHRIITDELTLSSYHPKVSLQKNNSDKIFEAFVMFSFQYPNQFLETSFPYLSVSKVLDYIVLDIQNGNSKRWLSPTKGSPFHYYQYFRSSPALNYIINELQAFGGTAKSW